jgi:3-isopropylmalate/(R)-2-methylmalate dehydratase large subunit
MSTIVEKIFQTHLEQGTCEPGEIVECNVDLIMVHEMLGDQIARIASEAGLKRVWDPDKVVALLDHYVPPSTEKMAIIHQEYRKFVHDYKILNDLGMATGVCHVVVPERGFVLPGMFVVGSDSHTTTYGALNCFSTGLGATDSTVVLAKGKTWFKVPRSWRIELQGTLQPLVTAKDVALTMLGQYGTDGMNYKSIEIGMERLDTLSVEGRLTVANLGVEMGAKCTIFEADEATTEWLQSHGVDDTVTPVTADPEAVYEGSTTFDLGTIEPVIAVPPSPSNVKPVDEIGTVDVDQVFIGSCTNGRMEDIRLAAKVLGSNMINRNVRCIIIPASREVYLGAMNEGLIDQFVRAGAMVEYPTCGPCMGAQLGILGPNEVCVSTSNRNFPGRMGAASAQIYLASPATAMASAIAGRIVNPKEVAQ